VKEIENGTRWASPPFSKKASLPPMACKRQWGRGERGEEYKSVFLVGSSKRYPGSLMDRRKKSFSFGFYHSGKRFKTISGKV
jgi:hypothetical protein